MIAEIFVRLPFFNECLREFIQSNAKKFTRTNPSAVSKWTKNFAKFWEQPEEKIFLQLQKYNLLYVTSKEVFKTTRKGEQALKGDVENHIFLERFEARLIKDSFKKRREEKIVLIAVVPIIILSVICIIFRNELN